MLTRISAKAAAVTASIVIGAGVAAAAATGSLPGQTSSGSDLQTQVNGPTTTSSTSSTVKESTNSPTTEDQKGPDVTKDSADLHGLCNAWHHNSDEAKAHSEAMQALEKAAGGKANVDTFCQQNAPATATPSTVKGDDQGADTDEQGADTNDKADAQDANEHETEAPETDHATTSTTEAEHQDHATTSTTEVEKDGSDSGVSGS